MVAKRRTTLRNKAAAAAARNLEEVEDEELDVSSRSFLHQPRESKKEKQLNKHQIFLNRVLEKSSGRDDLAGISKSAVRRRKRKLRDELKPRMGDLLTSLREEDDLKQHVLEGSTDGGPSDGNSDPIAKKNVVRVLSKDERRAGELGYVHIRKNEPNIRNQKGAKALSIRETSRMNDILHNSSFQQNPFGALREAIMMKQQDRQ
ncbi:hypothetical protein HG536_0B01750 [Torulaspora globosa]|uniref:Ribosome biogenesis protein SLX9 n=1 Tax=Torulaspora globosa TaxID=48254 RepID=A0A7G3ZCS6_9SACH|nr:uncharacterized protein HG536_0B01750 [Torulaspora globosa]QLL31312.1 hypothetical protein HG536_0B01750 [Torulaspora globosa]